MEDFYNEVDNIVRDMPRIEEKEKIVAEIYKESPIKNELDALLDVFAFNSYINLDDSTVIQIDEKNEVDRKVKKKHKPTFQKNINLLIDFIDEISKYDLEDIHECSLLKGEMSEKNW